MAIDRQVERHDPLCWLARYVPTRDMTIGPGHAFFSPYAALSRVPAQLFCFFSSSKGEKSHDNRAPRLFPL